MATDVVGALTPSSAGYGAGLLVFSAATAGVVLQPGQYWFGISQYADNVGRQAYWDYSSESGTAALRSDTPWEAVYGKYAFSLSGVDAVVATPEPASLTLMATGLLGLSAVVRKRRAAPAA